MKYRVEYIHDNSHDTIVVEADNKDKSKYKAFKALREKQILPKDEKFFGFVKRIVHIESIENEGGDGKVEEERREMPEGVTEETGSCIYCGQMHFFHNIGLSQEQLNEAATEQCDCEEAKKYVKRKKRKRALEEKIKRTFEEEETITDILINCLPLLLEDKLDSLKLIDGDGVEGTAKKNSKGGIKVERKVTTKNCIEE